MDPRSLTVRTPRSRRTLDSLHSPPSGQHHLRGTETAHTSSCWGSHRILGRFWILEEPSVDQTCPPTASTHRAQCPEPLSAKRPKYLETLPAFTLFSQHIYLPQLFPRVTRSEKLVTKCLRNTYQGRAGSKSRGPWPGALRSSGWGKRAQDLSGALWALLPAGSGGQQGTGTLRAAPSWARFHASSSAS